MQKEDYSESIDRAWRKARKEKNAEAIFYYEQAYNKLACVSFASFKDSWAYSEWKKKNADKIEEMKQKYCRRF